MPFSAAISLGIAAIGASASAYGAYNSAQTGKKIARESQENEELRSRQMRLEAQRKEREIIRQAQAANAQSLSQVTNKGAASGSLLPGLLGQVQGQEGRALSAVNENLDIGTALFTNNAEIAGLQGQNATYQGIQSFGRDLFSASQGAGRISGQAGASSPNVPVGEWTTTTTAG